MMENTLDKFIVGDGVKYEWLGEGPRIGTIACINLTKYKEYYKNTPHQTEIDRHIGYYVIWNDDPRNGEWKSILSLTLYSRVW